MRNAGAIYQRNITPGLVPIFLDHEIGGKMRTFRSILLREGETAHPSFSFNIYTISRQKIFFVVCVHAERVTVIQQNTLASTGRLYFPRNYSRGNSALYTILPFSLSRLSLFLPLFFSFYIYVHYCSRVTSGSVVFEYEINEGNFKINISQWKI